MKSVEGWEISEMKKSNENYIATSAIALLILWVSILTKVFAL